MSLYDTIATISQQGEITLTEEGTIIITILVLYAICAWNLFYNLTELLIETAIKLTKTIGEKIKSRKATKE